MSIVPCEGAHGPAVEREPTAGELAAIEAEMPVIEAEVRLVDAECALAAAGPEATGWHHRRIRLAEQRVAAAWRAYRAGQAVAGEAVAS